MAHHKDYFCTYCNTQYVHADLCATGAISVGQFTQLQNITNYTRGNDQLYGFIITAPDEAFLSKLSIAFKKYPQHGCNQSFATWIDDFLSKLLCYYMSNLGIIFLHE